MYMNRVTIHNGRQVREMWGNPHLLHKFVLSLFPDGIPNPQATLGVTWRKETNSLGERFLLVQSHIPCDQGQNTSHYNQDITVQTKALEDVYIRLLQNTAVSYKTLVNPTIKTSGKVSPITEPAKAVDWWDMRLARIGARIDREALDLAFRPPAYVKKGDGHSFAISSVEISGLLEVTDSEKLLSGIKSGVGRSKAYGYGLVLLGKA